MVKSFRVTISEDEFQIFTQIKDSLGLRADAEVPLFVTTSLRPLSRTIRHTESVRTRTDMSVQEKRNDYNGAHGGMPNSQAN